METSVLTLMGTALGGLMLYGLIWLFGDLSTGFGFVMTTGWPAASEWAILTGVMTIGTIVGCIPAWRAFRNSLADGLVIRV
jgi:putative ABC transport system permease protein